MKVLFVDARASFDITELKNKILSKFKKGRFGLVANIQFLPQLEEIKQILPNSIVAGQVVGCNVLNTIKIKEKVNKESVIGISNTLNPESLENFSDVEYWINTACSRIEHPKIINFEDIPEEYLNVKPKVESFRQNLIKTKRQKQKI